MNPWSATHIDAIAASRTIHIAGQRADGSLCDWTPRTPAAPLTSEQLARLATLAAAGSQHAVPAGEVLFSAGDASYDFFVVLAGSAHVVERLGDAAERILASYGPAEFLGEIGMLTGERASLAGVMRSAGRVLRVPLHDVRRSPVTI